MHTISSRALGLRSFVAILTLAAAAHADEFDRVRTLIKARMAEQHVPGVSVAVARDGKIVWEEGFGFADVEHRVSADGNTVYSIASVTKPIVATALMISSERHKLDLDHPVNAYLGRAKLTARVGDAADATIRRVASHLGGLPEHYHFFYADQPRHLPSMDETIRRYGNITAPPGERFQYSNLGYGVLGYVLSGVFKRSLGDVLRDEVFQPLGMDDAHFGTVTCARCAVRYNDDGIRLPAYQFDHPGASAAWVSAHDLVLFGLFHAGTPLSQQRRILSDADRQQMEVIPEGQQRGYGIGWNVWRHPSGYTVIYHGGTMPGASADLTVIPEKRIVVAVLANRNSSLPFVINDEIIYNTLLPQPPATAQSKASAPEPAKPDSLPPKELVGTWSGALYTYQGLRPLLLEIHNSGEVDVTLSGKTTKLNKSSFHGSGLRGEFNGDLGISDARPDSLLVLALTPRDGGLAGVVTAYSPPGKRVEYGLSQWTEVTRQ